MSELGGAEEVFGDGVVIAPPFESDTVSTLALLKESKACENITIAPGALVHQQSQPPLTESEERTIHEEEGTSSSAAKLAATSSSMKTVFENRACVLSSSEEIKGKMADDEIKPNAVVVISENHVESNDMVATTPISSPATTIFSVSGAPSRKMNTRKPNSPQDHTNHVFPTHSDQLQAEALMDQLQLEKASQKTNHSADDTVSTNSRMARNPLTGTGVVSKDEFRSKLTKRKDGNPLLGLGYDTDDKDLGKAASAMVMSNSSLPKSAPVAQSHRIPPGGHSQGLW